MSTTTMNGARRLHHALACAAALVLAGCGGGGGNDAGSAPAPGSPTITSSNQKAVAADVLDTSTNASIPLLALDMMTSLPASPAAVAARRPGVGIVATLLRSGRPQASAAVLAASGNVPLGCEAGSGTLTGELASPSALAAGDSLTVVADHCRQTVDGAPVTLNGRLTMRVVSGAFDPDNARYHFVLNVAAQNFASETPTESNVANGNQQVDVEESGTGQGSVTVSGDMTYDHSTAAGRHVSTLRGGTQAFGHDGDHITLKASGAVETSNRFVGSISYQLATPAPLTWTGGRITGGTLRADATASALLVTVTGNAAFRLELDDNGDGAIEATSEAGETELSGLL